MVARINTPNNINRALNYNEQKVKNEQAELLHAEGFLKDTNQLNFKDKLRRFTSLIELNDRAKTNSLHISLNFDNSDKIDAVKLVDIAREYMSKIGFAEQPYLVYQHYDAGHPHLHIVTTSIRMDGSRIDTFNIGRNQSEKARKEIEQSFGLVKAEESKQRQEYQLKPVSAEKVQYGKRETKRAISNVLDAVLNTYKYTSVPELNAVLHQYNVTADRGNEDSRVFKNNGLVYRILDENGNKVGVPLKASDFYNKPTLKQLQEKFQQNETARQPYKVRVKNAIDLNLLKSPTLSIQDLQKLLEKDGISTVIRQNDTGIIYGITYVDHRTKCVFNGSDLGKQYSAKAIQERCGKVAMKDEQTGLQGSQAITTGNIYKQSLPANSEPSLSPSSTVLDTLLQPEYTSGFIPHQLKGKKKKKKRNIHL